MKENDIMKTYTPNPIDTSDVKLPAELEELAEKIAENVHEVWSAGRIADACGVQIVPELLELMNVQFFGPGIDSIWAD